LGKLVNAGRFVFRQFNKLRIEVFPSRQQDMTPLGELPPLILGCGTIHTLCRRRLSPYNAGLELLTRALECGYTALDTAAVYGNGASEKLIGRFLRSRKVRDRVIIIGKGGHPNNPAIGRLDAASLTNDLDQSLRNLGVDMIDLFMLHRDDPTLPVAVIMETLHRFVQAGKVRAVGASNWHHRRIEAANLYAIRHGLTPLSASSSHLSLIEQHAPPWPGCLSIAGDANAEAREWYAATQMPVLAWSPLGAGFLVGRENFDPGQKRAYVSETNLRRREVAQEIAKRKRVPVSHVGLAYVRSLGIDVRPIVYSNSSQRLAELAAAAALRLSPEEISLLELRTEAAAE
jgi:aryl-alcohol dehydrogenase-like predicted oxidoreductase